MSQLRSRLNRLAKLAPPPPEGASAVITWLEQFDPGLAYAATMLNKCEPRPDFPDWLKAMPPYSQQWHNDVLARLARALQAMPAAIRSQLAAMPTEQAKGADQ